MGKINIPIGKDGKFILKAIPVSKRVCPFSLMESKVGRLVGPCNGTPIIGVLSKFRKDETLDMILKRKRKIELELEKSCPLFDSCILEARCPTRLIIEKGENGEEVKRENVPILIVGTTEWGVLSEDEFLEAKDKSRKKLKRKIAGIKNPYFVGSRAKAIAKASGIRKDRSAKIITITRTNEAGEKFKEKLITLL